MARVSASMQLFGGQCTYDRVLKEMVGWSDHSLHSFAGGCTLVWVEQPPEVRAPSTRTHARATP